MLNKNKFQELIDLGYIVRPPYELKNYYTIGNRENGRYINIKSDEELDNESIISMLSSNEDTHYREIHCICDSDSCKLEHHQCSVYNYDPFQDCIHIMMRDGKTECYGCNELWQELKEEKEFTQSLTEQLEKEKKDVHNLMMKFIPEYKQSYDKLSL